MTTTRETPPGARRYAEHGGSDAAPPVYPPAERERQVRLAAAIERAVAQAEERTATYLPPETEGVTAYMDEQHRQRFLAQHRR